MLDNNGGRGEIRTHGGREPTSVFKTGALNHSATLPNAGFYHSHKKTRTIILLLMCQDNQTEKDLLFS